MGGGTVPSNLAYLCSDVSSPSFSTTSACRLIGWNNGGAPSMQPYGGGAGGGMQHQVMDCAKAFVGTTSPSQSSLLIVWDLLLFVLHTPCALRHCGKIINLLQLRFIFSGKIIGRGGEVITMIQQRSGAKVQIDQNVPEGNFNKLYYTYRHHIMSCLLLSQITKNSVLFLAGQPCKVNMSGTPQNLAIATQLVQEAMLGVKSQGGGMGQQGGYGGRSNPHVPHLFLLRDVAALFASRLINMSLTSMCYFAVCRWRNGHAGAYAAVRYAPAVVRDAHAGTDAIRPAGKIRTRNLHDCYAMQ
jgi:hypothetical protein